MATAYTPGLTVSHDHPVVKERRLPVPGEIVVEVGQEVQHDTVLARAELSGEIETVRLAERMQMDPDELQGKVRVSVGDSVARGQLLAESAGLFGLFRSEVKSPVEGKVEFFAESTGHLGIRRPPSHIELRAYVRGRVSAIAEKQGVTVQTCGAFIQGIFGIGGERHGAIQVLADSPEDHLEQGSIDSSCAGNVIVGGAWTTLGAIRKAAEVGVSGIVVGGIQDDDLGQYLGYELGVAITGDENVPLTLILTEGFGHIRMAGRTFALLKDLEGQFASINGATQIRAGALRPEIIVPHQDSSQWADKDEASPGRAQASRLETGMTVRAIRRPHFGQLCQVLELPPEPVRVPSGAVVRVVRVRLENGNEVLIPRSNVEVIEEAEG